MVDEGESRIDPSAAEDLEVPQRRRAPRGRPRGSRNRPTTSSGARRRRAAPLTVHVTNDAGPSNPQNVETFPTTEMSDEHTPTDSQQQREPQQEEQRPPPARQRSTGRTNTGADPQNQQLQPDVLDLLRGFIESLEQRFPCQEGAHTAGDQPMAQESIHSLAQRRARGKTVQEEPSRRKKPSPTSRKEPALKMKAGAWKPPIDLRDHLNKRAVAQTTRFDVSTSHRSPHART